MSRYDPRDDIIQPVSNFDDGKKLIVNLISKATSLFFLLFNIAQPKKYLLAYCSVYNVFFMDLPVSSFEFSSSLLIWWMASFVYFDYRGAFQTVLDLYCCVMG